MTPIENLMRMQRQTSKEDSTRHSGCSRESSTASSTTTTTDWLKAETRMTREMLIKTNLEIRKLMANRFDCSTMTTIGSRTVHFDSH